MTRVKMLRATGLSVLTTLVLAVGLAPASHVGSQLSPPPGASSLLSVPGTLQVDQIRANQVRARVVYGNRIEADHVQGAIYQTAGLQNFHGRGEINAPDVSASIVYADTIRANVVAADAVYVRDLRIK